MTHTPPRAPRTLALLTSLALAAPLPGQVKPVIAPSDPGPGRSIQGSDSSERIVVGVGRSTIRAEDLTLARELALRAAYADAVAQGSGVNVGSLTVVANMKTLSDVIVSKTSGKIAEFTVLGEGRDERNHSVYEVRIRARVARDQLSEEDEREALRLYLEVLGQPRILVILPQFTSAIPEPRTPASKITVDTSARIEGATVTMSEVEITPATESSTTATGLIEVVTGAARSPEYALAQALSAYGYQVITSDDLVASRGVSVRLLEAARKGITASALEVAKAADADLALLGVLQVTTARVRPSGVEFVSATVEASGKALIVSSGYLVDAYHRTSTRAHQNALAASASAIERIAADIASALAWKIPSLLTQNLRQTTLILDGASLTQLDAAQSHLSKLPFVETVSIERLPTTDAPSATLRLQTGFIRADAREILEALEQVLGRGKAVLLNQTRFELRFQLK